jgi:UDP-N-acetylmuramoyl-tripeptide--D-alanyl-D-alanine ligase
VKKALSEFRPRSYRAGYARLLAMVAANGARLLNDTYNSNPDSVSAALVTLGAMKPGKGGRRIAVLGDMKELGASSAEEHRRIGREAAGDRRLDIVIFHGEEMRHAYEAAREVKRSKAESLFFDRKEELADAVAAMLKPEDILLVKGSRGMRMEEVVRRVAEGETAGRRDDGTAGRREKT